MPRRSRRSRSKSVRRRSRRSSRRTGRRRYRSTHEKREIQRAKRLIERGLQGPKHIDQLFAKYGVADFPGLWETLGEQGILKLAREYDVTADSLAQQVAKQYAIAKEKETRSKYSHLPPRQKLIDYIIDNRKLRTDKVVNNHPETFDQFVHDSPHEFVYRLYDSEIKETIRRHNIS